MFQLVVPNVLTEARGLSPYYPGGAVALGLLLWLLGWRWHRFFVVATVTTAAGVVGLAAGKEAGGSVLVIGLLLSVAAGVLAVEISRIVAFVAGGVAAWYAVNAVLPGAQEVWAGSLAGGIVGVLLYRLWMMLFTSLAGLLLAVHGGLILAEPMFKFDAAEWATKQAALLNGLVIAGTLIGLVLQGWVGRLRTKSAEPKVEKKKPAPLLVAVEPDEPEPKKAGWKLIPWKRDAA